MRFKDSIGGSGICAYKLVSTRIGIIWYFILMYNISVFFIISIYNDALW